MYAAGDRMGKAMGIDEKTIAQIVGLLVEAGGPDRIILFGSAATGTMTPDSDVDLLVLERDPGDARREMTRLRLALWDVDRPIDLVVMPTDRFEATKHVVGGIAYPAHRYGRVIYDAA